MVPSLRVLELIYIDALTLLLFKVDFLIFLSLAISSSELLVLMESLSSMESRFFLLIIHRDSFSCRVKFSIFVSYRF